jgi:4a-hydroxytetrahydrobiopterin dehydratase
VGIITRYDTSAAGRLGDDRRPRVRAGLKEGAMPMANLAAEKCVACRPGAPPVTNAERSALHAEIPAWRVAERDGVERLERAFTFSDFASALAFTNRVGAVAEAEGHHPAVLTEWGRVTVSWWTHAIGGLHRNDFIMAAKTDAVARR